MKAVYESTYEHHVFKGDGSEFLPAVVYYTGDNPHACLDDVGTTLWWRMDGCFHNAYGPAHVYAGAGADGYVKTQYWLEGKHYNDRLEWALAAAEYKQRKGLPP